MAPIVTVALPVLDGGPLLGEVLAAVKRRSSTGRSSCS